MENMVAESIKYMILGMGIVFVFLYTMVLVLQYQAKLIAKYFPENLDKSNDKDSKKLDKKKVAAVIAAIQHHKNLGK